LLWLTPVSISRPETRFFICTIWHQQMSVAQRSALTPDVARQVCQRAGSKAYIAGSIACLGSEYVLTLKAVNRQSRDLLAQEQATAASKERGLDTLGTTAAKLRGSWESRWLQCRSSNVPLSEAATPSLEALQAYSAGRKALHEKGASAALPYNQRSIELDTNFATRYHALGTDYANLGELGRASDYFTRAFQLKGACQRERSWRSPLIITELSRGELEKAEQTYLEWIANYPQNAAYGNLGITYATEGRYDKAEEAYRQALQLAPDYVGSYDDLANSLLAMQRFDEARRVVAQERAHNLDDFISHDALYAVVFLRGDASGMAEEQQWFAGKTEENTALSLASDTEAFAGQLGKARELTRRSIDSAIHADSKETGAINLENSALREAAFGNLMQAKQVAEEGLKLVPTSQRVEVEAALAYAVTGDSARAEAMTQDLNKRCTASSASNSAEDQLRS